MDPQQQFNMSRYWSYFMNIQANTHHPQRDDLIKYMLQLYLSKISHADEPSPADIPFMDYQIINNLVSQDFYLCNMINNQQHF